MKIRPVIFLSIFVLCLLILGLSLPAAAAPAPQGVQFATNTPGPDGRILYKVVAGDTCIRIALLHGISVEQLRQLNSNLDPDCSLITGQELLVGLGGPLAATATPGPSPTPLPATATPTPFVGSTEICVLVFDDQNGDGLRHVPNNSVTRVRIASGSKLRKTKPR